MTEVVGKLGSVSSTSARSVAAPAEQPTAPSEKLVRGFDRLGFLQDRHLTAGNSHVGEIESLDPQSSVAATDAKRQQRLKQNMLKYLDGLEYEFGVQYAPAEFKAQMHNWSLEEQFKLVREKVQNAAKPTVEEFQNLVRDIVLSTRDYHVSMHVASCEKARLPFTVQGVGEGANRKYFVVAVAEEFVGVPGLPFAVGTEIVRFDGKAVAEAVDEVRKEISVSDGPTDRALAESALTARAAAKVMKVPKGPITVTMRDAKGQTSECKLQWDYVAEEHPTPTAFGGGEKGASSVPVRNLIGGAKLATEKTTGEDPRDLILKNPMQNMAYLSKDELREQGPENPFALGAHRSFVPRLGKVLAEAKEDSPFDWSICQNAKGQRIGYVRISDYTPDDGNKTLLAFAAIMKAMQKNTDALVIDQVNNPGGSVMYLSALASCLTDQPLTTPKHHMAITQKSAQKAEMLEKVCTSILASPDPEKMAQKLFGPLMDGYPVTVKFIEATLKYAQTTLTEFDAGHQVTKATNLFGVDNIEPFVVPECRYKKPLLFLTNERCFSGGDFMPAILQDNKRATIFGARTAGAGGYVNSIETENLFGIDSIHVTGSLAERAVGGKPLEEYGVTPDVPYDLTEQDMRSGCVGYVAAVNAAVAKLLEGRPATTKVAGSVRAQRTSVR